MTGDEVSRQRLQMTRELGMGIDEMGLDISLQNQQRLLLYLQLLNKWNKAFNLTAVRDRTQMVSRQLLDSLSILPLIRGERVLDVGSGGGLPGIPLAIADAGRDYYLLDSNSKKTRFLTQVKMEMRLNNVFVKHERLEKYVPAQPFDSIVSRAFSSLPTFVDGSRRLLQKGGVWLAMKGKLPENEINSLGQKYEVETRSLQVPGERGERCVVMVWKARDTSR